MTDFIIKAVIILFFLISLDLLFIEKSVPSKIMGGFLTFLFSYLFIKTEIKNKKDVQKRKRLRGNISFGGGKVDKFLGKDLLELINDTNSLMQEIDWFNMYSDYSFVLFPIGKAFEGFLKKILLKQRIIKESDLLLDPNVSIGEYFHPKDGLINKRIKTPKRYKAIPSKIYSVYQDYRNKLFHYDLHSNTKITYYEEATFIIGQIEMLIVEAYSAYIIFGKKIKLENSNKIK